MKFKTLLARTMNLSLLVLVGCSEDSRSKAVSSDNGVEAKRPTQNMVTAVVPSGETTKSEVNPKHQESGSILQDNDRMQLVLLKVAPGSRSSLPDAREIVCVALSPVDGRVLRGETTVRPIAIEMGAGFVLSDAEGLTFENVSKREQQIMIGAVKRTALRLKPMKNVGPDVVRTAPKNYRVIADGDKMRAIMGRFGPKERDNWHSLQDYIFYAITDVKGMAYIAGGGSSEVEFKRDGSAIQEALPMLSWENTSKMDQQFLLFESKP